MASSRPLPAAPACRWCRDLVANHGLRLLTGPAFLLWGAAELTPNLDALLKLAAALPAILVGLAMLFQRATEFLKQIQAGRLALPLPEAPPATPPAPDAAPAP